MTAFRGAHLRVVAVVFASGVLTCGVAATTAGAATPALWKNCTAVNKRYSHGVGKVGARDKTSGEPVTNFRRSNKLYATAMHWNKGLDRDKDGIACETL
jgi:Excalibur calcium-binding domain